MIRNYMPFAETLFFLGFGMWQHDEKKEKQKSKITGKLSGMKIIGKMKTAMMD